MDKDTVVSEQTESGERLISGTRCGWIRCPSGFLGKAD